VRSTRSSRSTVTTANSSSTTAKARMFRTSAWSSPIAATAVMSPISTSSSRNTRSCGGHRGPTRASSPSTKPRSPASTIGQPRAGAPLGFTARYSSAGTASPPRAAAAGTVMARQGRSSPSFSWRLNSKPTTRKNSVIRPSLTQWRRSLESSAWPTWTDSLVDHNVS
jgi:hypothetical protein